MNRLVESAKRRWYAVGAAVGGGGLVAPTAAMADAQDYSSLGTGAAAEISAAIPVGLGILVLTLGIPIAIRILKRVAS